MLTITETIKQEINKFNRKLVFGKLNSTYISGDAKGILEFNIEFKGFNGCTIIKKIKTCEKPKNIVDHVNINNFNNNEIYSLDNIKEILLSIFDKQLQNFTKIKTYNKICNSNLSWVRSYYYNNNLNENCANSFIDEVNNIKTNVIDVLNDKNKYDKIYEEVTQTTNNQLSDMKEEIMTILDIPKTGKAIIDKNESNYVDELKILSNYINEYISIYNKTTQDYLNDIVNINYMLISKPSVDIDLNLYIFDGNNIYSLHESNMYINTILSQINNNMYGEDSNNLLKLSIHNTLKNLKPIKEYKNVVENILKDNYNDTFDSLMINYQNIPDDIFQFMIYDIELLLLTKHGSMVLYNYTNEMQDSSIDMRSVKLAIYDFETYKYDFNISFIITSLELMQNIAKCKKTENISKLEKLSKIQKNLAIVNDVFQLNTIMNNVYNVVGFNSFSYDNALLFDILYNLHTVGIDITEIIITKEDVEYLDKVIATTKEFISKYNYDYNEISNKNIKNELQKILENNIKYDEFIQNNIKHIDLDVLFGFNNYYTSDVEHNIQVGSILYNINNSIIDKLYKTIDKKAPITKQQYLTAFLKVILKNKIVNVYNDVDNITSRNLVDNDKFGFNDNILTTFESRTLTNSELNKLKLAYAAGYKGVASIDVKDEMIDDFVSLKVIEGYLGLSIEEFEDFNIDHKLTTEQMNTSVNYCNHDVYATHLALIERLDFFVSKIEMLELFKLNYKYIVNTRSRIVAMGLGLKSQINYDDRLDFNYLDHLDYIYNNQKLDEYNNLEYESLFKIMDHFKNITNIYNNTKLEDTTLNKNSIISTLESKGIKYNIMGVPHDIKFGGLHGCLNKIMYFGTILAADAGSYYPTLMIMYKLYSRTVPIATFFLKLYLHRMILKQKKDAKQKPYKIALNSNFGTLKDSTSKAFDPLQANNICVNGQLALIDLLARLNGKTTLLQSNTDGIYITGNSDPKYMEELKEIAYSWEKDYKIKLEIDEYHGLIQKDVNSYILFHKDHVKKAKCKGDFKKYNKGIDIDQYANTVRYLDQVLTEYYLYKLGVNDEFKNNLTDETEMIQYAITNLIKTDISSLQQIVKKGAFDYMIQNVEMTKDELIEHIKTRYNTTISENEFDNITELANKHPNIFDEIIQDGDIYKCKLMIQRVNRLFATKNTKFGIVEKVKYKDGAKSYSKVPSSSSHAIVYNKEILGDNVNIDDIIKYIDIDVDYYTQEILRNVKEFNIKPIDNMLLLPNVQSQNWSEIVTDHISTTAYKKTISSNLKACKDKLKDMLIINDNTILTKCKKLISNLSNTKTIKDNTILIQDIQNDIYCLNETLQPKNYNETITDYLDNLKKYLYENIYKESLTKKNQIHWLKSQKELMLILNLIKHNIEMLNDLGIQINTNNEYIKFIDTILNITDDTKIEVLSNNPIEYTVSYEKLNIDEFKNILDKCIDLDNDSKKLKTKEIDKDIIKNKKTEISNIIKTYLDDKQNHVTLFNNTMKSEIDTIYGIESNISGVLATKGLKIFKQYNILTTSILNNNIHILYINKIINSINNNLKKLHIL